MGYIDEFASTNFTEQSIWYCLREEDHMKRKIKPRWEIPDGQLKYDLFAHAAKSEKDFDTKTLKGHFDLLMFQAIHSVPIRTNEIKAPSLEFIRQVELEFQSLCKKHPPRISQSVQTTIETYSDEAWKALKEKRLQDGKEHHRRMYEKGNSMGLEILYPKLVPQGGEFQVELRAVELDFDESLLYRQKMFSLAQDILTEDLLLNERINPVLADILGKVVAGEQLYEFSVAELFELYGELASRYPECNIKKQLHKWIDGKGFESIVSDALLGRSLTVQHYPHSKTGYSCNLKLVPLPYAVRNMIAHQETSNPNVALLGSMPYCIHDSVVILKGIKSHYFNKS